MSSRHTFVSILVVAGFLTGCLEGSQLHYYDPLNQKAEARFPAVSDTYLKSPLGYPLQGEFAGSSVTRITVQSLDELRNAITNQTGPTVITIAAKLRLNETLAVKFPLIINTIEGIGAPDSELEFNYQPDLDHPLPTGRLVVDIPGYENRTSIACAKQSSRAGCVDETNVPDAQRQNA